MGVLNWLIALLGLWEAGDVVALFVPGFGDVKPAVWNHIAVGIILMVAGAWAGLTRHASTARKLAWVTGVAGLWLILASFLLRDPLIAVGLLNDVAVGVLVVVLSAASGLLVGRRA